MPDHFNLPTGTININLNFPPVTFELGERFACVLSRWSDSVLANLEARIMSAATDKIAAVKADAEARLEAEKAEINARIDQSVALEADMQAQIDDLKAQVAAGADQTEILAALDDLGGTTAKISDLYTPTP